MKGDPVPPSNHILRHIKGKWVHGGKVDPEAFQRTEERPDAISVNWLEFWGTDKEAALDSIRQRLRLKSNGQHRLAMLRIADAIDALANFPQDISVIEAPLEAKEALPADPSHALIVGLPARDSVDSDAAAASLAGCVTMLFPALVAPKPAE